MVSMSISVWKYRTKRLEHLEDLGQAVDQVQAAEDLLQVLEQAVDQVQAAEDPPQVLGQAVDQVQAAKDPQ